MAKAPARVVTRTGTAFPQMRETVFLVGVEEVAWVRPLYGGRYTVTCILPIGAICSNQLYAPIVTTFAEQSLKDEISKWFARCGVELDWEAKG